MQLMLHFYIISSKNKEYESLHLYVTFETQLSKVYVWKIVSCLVPFSSILTTNL